MSIAAGTMISLASYDDITTINFAMEDEFRELVSKVETLERLVEELSSKDAVYDLLQVLEDTK